MSLDGANCNAILFVRQKLNHVSLSQLRRSIYRCVLRVQDSNHQVHHRGLQDHDQGQPHHCISACIQQEWL